MTITTVGIDLAKNVFAVHGVDQNGRTVLVKPKVSRAALPELIASLPPCVIGMEACSGAHYWARLFRQYGHEPRLMAAKFVSPYRMAGKSGKNDAADAQAICEEKTATYNRLRGLISEFGVIAPQSADALRHMVSVQKSSLPLQVQQCVDDLMEHVDRIEANITEYDRILSHIAKTDHRSQRLMELKGVGPTTACALVASIGNAHDFKNGRQLAAWLGLTPSQYSAGSQKPVIRICERFWFRGLVQCLLAPGKGLTHSAVGFVCWLSAEGTGGLLWPSPPKMRGCVGHHYITVMISGCTQSTKARSCITI